MKNSVESSNIMFIMIVTFPSTSKSREKYISKSHSSMLLSLHNKNKNNNNNTIDNTNNINKN